MNPIRSLLIPHPCYLLSAGRARYTAQIREPVDADHVLQVPPMMNGFAKPAKGSTGQKRKDRGTTCWSLIMFGTLHPNCLYISFKPRPNTRPNAHLHTNLAPAAIPAVSPEDWTMPEPAKRTGSQVVFSPCLSTSPGIHTPNAAWLVLAP